ncbi:hypothetical protein [Paenibacillus larvae]|uniref:Uncharacterized protein n=1 Tax=Paenibacillus larvae subsp. larvae TaxID=147375 RepID=A0A6C0QZ38_9BACL|nr:hypothetical protein [Paenibacillus larvae]QHZ54015.1 hypothetical protein ERICV_05031 [Paenibacillus larvae subsp. larvae]
MLNEYKPVVQPMVRPTQSQYVQSANAPTVQVQQPKLLRQASVQQPQTYSYTPDYAQSVKQVQPISLPKPQTRTYGVNSNVGLSGVNTGAGLPDWVNVDWNPDAIRLPTLDEVQGQWGLMNPEKYGNTLADMEYQRKIDALDSQWDQFYKDHRRGLQGNTVETFKQALARQQDLATRGINAGIASDLQNQDRMDSMAKTQKLLQDYQKTSQDIATKKGIAGIERNENALKMQREELQKQIDLAFKMGNYEQAKEFQKLDAMLKQAELINNARKWIHEQNYQKGRDSVKDSQWQKEHQLSKDKVAWEKSKK